jgi:hypothetical protein
MTQPIKRKTRQSLIGLAILLCLMPLGTTLAELHAQTINCNDLYVVQASDWLSKISDKFLGDLRAFPAIVIATNQQHAVDPTFPDIVSPDWIEIGWKLCIPDTQTAQALLVQTNGEAASVTTTSSLTPPDDTAARDPSADVDLPEVSVAAFTLDDFVAEHQFSPLAVPGWIYVDPEKTQKFEVLPAHQAARDKFGYRANYLWNEHLQDSYFTTTGIFDAIPDTVYLFESPWDNVLPKYRYPPNVTLPTGLTTNQYGWRGKPIDLNKPPKVIRIAAVGASTTVGVHIFPYSYPEHLETWLNLWAEHNGYDVRFEVINAGREGLSSGDILHVLRYEVLPMEVDYVLYYEGANQFNIRSVVSYPDDITFGRPPPGLVPNFGNIDSEDKGFLDTLAEHSALAGRVRSFIEAFQLTGEEPPKPEQTFGLPAGVDELNPDLATVGSLLDLERVLRDLNRIKADLEANEAKLLIGTFDWFVYDGLILDPQRHRNIYGHLNRVYWPISYANMRRAADFQNRVIRKWAAANGVPLAEVADQMPRQPDLYDDAIHNKPLGGRIRGWLFFESLLPLLKADIESGALPRPDREYIEQHPYIKPEYQIKNLSGN